MKEKEEYELVPMVIRIPKFKKDMIKNIAKNEGRFEANIIRSGIDKELNLDMYQDKLQELIKEVLKPLEERMDKFLKTQRKINTKYLKTIAVNTYVNCELMENLLGDTYHNKFNKMLSNVKKKADYYLFKRTDGMTKEDLYDFYFIGDIYREDYRNE